MRSAFVSWAGSLALLDEQPARKVLRESEKEVQTVR